MVRKLQSFHIEYSITEIILYPKATHSFLHSFPILISFALSLSLLSLSLAGSPPSPPRSIRPLSKYVCAHQTNRRLRGTFQNTEVLERFSADAVYCPAASDGTLINEREPANFPGEESVHSFGSAEFSRTAAVVGNVRGAPK